MKGLKITDLLGLGSVSAFLLTIVFVYGYSLAIGYNLFAYFNLNDYFRLAIQWLTPTVVTVLVGVLFSQFLTRTERGASEDEIAAASPNPRMVRAFRKSGEYAPLVTIVVLAFAYTIFAFFIKVPRTNLYMLWVGAGPIIWVALVNWYSKESKLVAHWSKPWRVFVTFFPAVVISVFFLGMLNGHKGSQLFGKDFEVRIVLEGQKDPYPGRILFVLDEFLLVREGQSDQLALIPRGQVKLIVHNE